MSTSFAEARKVAIHGAALFVAQVYLLVGPYSLHSQVKGQACKIFHSFNLAEAIYIFC